METKSTETKIPARGDVVRINKNGRRTFTVEVEHVWPEAGGFTYLLPYASTYVEGGQYEGSYRGRGVATSFSQIVEA